MTQPNHRLACRPFGAAPRAGLITLMLGVALLGGCASGLLPKPQAQPTWLALDDAAAAGAMVMSSGATGATLVVDTPRAAAGFDTRNIVYMRRPHEIEYFALHQWVDTPAQMIAPLIVRALQRHGAFRAVALAPSAAAGELRLETELVRLQQDFTQSPSRVRLTLRALLIESASRRVLAWREFDAAVVASSDDPYGGAAAANRALQQVLTELAAFCAKEARR